MRLESRQGLVLFNAMQETSVKQPTWWTATITTQAATTSASWPWSGEVTSAAAAISRLMCQPTTLFLRRTVVPHYLWWQPVRIGAIAATSASSASFRKVLSTMMHQSSAAQPKTMPMLTSMFISPSDYPRTTCSRSTSSFTSWELEDLMSFSRPKLRRILETSSTLFSCIKCSILSQKWLMIWCKPWSLSSQSMVWPLSYAMWQMLLSTQKWWRPWRKKLDLRLSSRTIRKSRRTRSLWLRMRNSRS